VITVETAEALIKRSGGKCEVIKGDKGRCKNKAVQFHHMKSRKFGSDELKNLVFICLQCHKDITEHRHSEYTDNYLTHFWQEEGKTYKDALL